MPCANHFAPSTKWDSSSKTSIKTRPIIFLFVSGSLSPAKSFKKRAEASTPFTLSPIPSYCFNTSVNSFFLKSPLFTKMQWRFFPIALCNNTAATEESTPPDKPNITFSSPIFSFNSATVLSTKASGVHDCSILAILTKKFSKTCFPSVEWYTSGWNWIA